MVESLKNVKLGIDCSCKKSMFNVHYQLTRTVLYYVFPFSWEIEDIDLECCKCGKHYKLNDKQWKEAEEWLESQPNPE